MSDRYLWCSMCQGTGDDLDGPLLGGDTGPCRACGGTGWWDVETQTPVDIAPPLFDLA